MTRQDSALDEFHGAERLYWEDNNPDSAAEAYVKVYDDFPETDYGSKSLYAAAWIYDFVLDKNRTAKKLYELLCDSFPKTSYCLEAKPRLKTVADTVAALRAQKKLPQLDARRRRRQTGRCGKKARLPAFGAQRHVSRRPEVRRHHHGPRLGCGKTAASSCARSASGVPPAPAQGVPSAGPDQSMRYRRIEARDLAAGLNVIKGCSCGKTR